MGAVVPDRDDLVLGLRESVFFLGRGFKEGRAQRQDGLVGVEPGVSRDNGEVGVPVGIEQPVLSTKSSGCYCVDGSHGEGRDEWAIIPFELCEELELGIAVGHA